VSANIKKNCKYPRNYDKHFSFVGWALLFEDKYRNRRNSKESVERIKLYFCVWN